MIYDMRRELISWNLESTSKQHEQEREDGEPRKIATHPRSKAVRMMLILEIVCAAKLLLTGGKDHP